MKTIAIISQKGDGQNDVCDPPGRLSVPRWFGLLVVDTDPQATASTWHSWRGDNSEPDVIDCGSPALLPKKLAQAEELGAELVIIDTPPMRISWPEKPAGLRIFFSFLAGHVRSISMQSEQRRNWPRPAKNLPGSSLWPVLQKPPSFTGKRLSLWPNSACR